MGCHPEPAHMEGPEGITDMVDTAVIAGNAKIAEGRLDAAKAGPPRAATGITRSSDVTTTVQAISSSSTDHLHELGRSIASRVRKLISSISAAGSYALI